jgi:hypothetical protein
MGITRRLVVGATIVLVLQAGQASAADTPVAEVSQLRMYSSFWQNLHHFLYVSAWAKRPVEPRTRRLAMPLPPGSDVAMTREERATWDNAVAVYDREFASKDLLFDFGMLSIKGGLVDRDDNLTGAPYDDELRSLLLSAAPIYRKYWWPGHDAANRAWIAEAARRTAPHATPIISKLTALYGVAWFSTPVRVDVVRVGKSQGAYTSINPTHIVVASGDDSYDTWASTEMLFHESSHALIQKVQAAVNAALTAAHKRAGDLWHVVLFYTAGEVTRQQLAKAGVEYKPYLYATGLFDRAWPQFRAPVESHVQAYIDGKKTLDQMAADLAAAVP